MRPSIFALLFTCFFTLSVFGQRQTEKLNRGVVATSQGGGKVHVGWRMFGDDPSDITFNLYLSVNGGTAVKVNSKPMILTTDTLLGGLDLTKNLTFSVKPIIKGVEGAVGGAFTLPANAPVRNYLSIPIHKEPTDGAINNGKVAFGDLDGDGEYEMVMRWVEIGFDPGSAHTKTTSTAKLDAYKLNGTFLWRIDLGINVELGDDYNPVLVYDMDGDGKAEVISRSAEGTKDGVGNVIGDVNGDTISDYRQSDGRILSGPEFISIYQGTTGKELGRTPEIPMGNVADWGDSYGNRGCRHLLGIAYLDGVRPSIVNCRGVYELQKVETWNFRNGLFTKVWAWTNGNLPKEQWDSANQMLRCGDIDDDGKDEVIKGSLVIDHNGNTLYSMGLGHGDRYELSVLDPQRKGLQAFTIHEESGENAVEMHDAKTGKIIWGKTLAGDPSQCIAAHIDPRYKGLQMWSGGTYNLYDTYGNVLSTTSPGANNRYGVYWGGDLTRAFMSFNSPGMMVRSWDTTTNNYKDIFATGRGILSLGNVADILGDWREEIVVIHPTEIRVFTTEIPSCTRMYTLMHDPIYRLSSAEWVMRNPGSPLPGFYLGTGMSAPPIPPMVHAKLKWAGGSNANKWDLNASSNWINRQGATSTFAQGDSVLFDLSGDNASAVLFTDSIKPGLVTVHSNIDYTFAGTGALTGAMQFVKAGPAKVTFNTNNNYTGTTRVTDGTLLVNGILNKSAVSVTNLGTLGGSGTIGCPVSIEKGGTLMAGDTTLAATLITGSLIEKGDVTTLFDLSDNPSGTLKANDKIIVNGDLTFLGKNTIQLNLLNNALATGSYTLFEYTGNFTGQPTNFQITGNQGYPCELALSAGKLNLIVKEKRPAGKVVWIGSQSSSWDAGTSRNWLREGSSDYFANNDTVLMDDRGAAQRDILLSDVVSAKSFTVDSKYPYSIKGFGGLSGNFDLVKNNTGNLRLFTSNTYTGKTMINGGSIELSSFDDAGKPSSIGAPTSTDPSYLVLNDAKLLLGSNFFSTNRGITFGGQSDTLDNNGANVTLLGLMQGTGRLVKTGSGNLLIQGKTNTYTGGTVVKGGSIVLGDDLANRNGLGADNSSITLDGGSITMYSNFSSYNSTYWNLVVPANATGTLNTDARCDFYGSLTGAGTLNMTVSNVRTTLNANWSAFTGILNVALQGTATAAQFRVNNSAGYANATINLGAGITMNHATAGGPISIGELTGVGTSVLSSSAFTVGAKNTNAQFDGLINGTSSVTKVGSGSWTLTNANTYTGTTTVTAGSLIVSNTTGSATGTGAVSVTGTLEGTGIVGGTVTVNSGGTLSPGNHAVGNLTVNNIVTLKAGSTLEVEIDKATNTNDQLVLTAGTLTLGGTLNITKLGTANFAVNNSFKILTAPVIKGSFSAINPATPGIGLVWDTTQLAVSGIVQVKNAQTNTIEGLPYKQAWQVYPNPFTNSFSLHADEVANSSYVLYDATGTIVQSGTIHNAFTEVKTNTLSTGLYILRIYCGDKKTEIPIIKQ